jgi:hypothetical protein
MKLDEYINLLNKIKKQYGGKLECVYSKDDEGNGFHKIFYHPSIGKYNSREEYFESTDTPENINSVCVN